MFELINELNTTTIIVNHDITDSLEISDRILVLVKGKINNYDTPYAVYSKPKCLESACLFGVLNRINIHEQQFYCRPEHIELQLSGISASVINSTFVGPHYRVTAQLNNENIVFYNNKMLFSGEKIHLGIDTKKGIYFD